MARILISVVGHSGVVTDRNVASRYDAPFFANLSGPMAAEASRGTPGLDGAAGVDANPTFPDPTTGLPKPAGPGGNGSNGGRGGDGGNGGAASLGATVPAVPPAPYRCQSTQIPSRFRAS